MPIASAPPSPAQLELGLFTHSRPMVSVQEVAEKFGVSTEQIRILIEEGSLQVVPVGSQASRVRVHFRVVRASAEALYIHRQKTANGQAPPYLISPEAKWWLDQLEARMKRRPR